MENHNNDVIEQVMSVDRRLLEHILLADKYVLGREHLFDQIAKTHDIISITVEDNFKIGSKSRKAPNLYICGGSAQLEAVNAACQELAEYFDSETNKVVATVAIPSEKHYYVIGKEGCNVKPLMSLTGCHIHFPDTTRDGFSNKPIKNHVTITGNADNVEFARVSLRGHMPIIISFPVPDVVPPSETVMTPRIRALSRTFSLTIFFKQNNNVRYMFFKGARNKASNLEAAACEILSAWGIPSSSSSQPASLSDYNDIFITAQFDVPCIYHNAIKANQALNALARQTQTRVEFHQEGISSILYITGQMESIKMVMAQLQCELPYSIMFDLKEDTSQSILLQASETEETLDDILSSIVNEKIDVSANLARTVVQVTIRGREGGVGAIYRARREILQHYHQPMVQNFGYGSLDIDSKEMDFLRDDPAFFPPYHGARFGGLFGHAERMPELNKKKRSPIMKKKEVSPRIASSPTPSTDTLSPTSTSEARRSAFAEKSIGDYETRRRIAETVISRPVQKEERHPTNWFTGDFFSRSMSAAELKKNNAYVASMADVREEDESSNEISTSAIDSEPQRLSRLSLEVLSTLQRPFSHQSHERPQPNSREAILEQLKGVPKLNTNNENGIGSDNHADNQQYSSEDTDKFPILKRAQDVSLEDSQDFLHEHSMGSLPPLDHSFSASSLASSLGHSSSDPHSHIASSHADLATTKVSAHSPPNSIPSFQMNFNAHEDAGILARNKRRNSSTTSNNTASTTPVPSVFSPTISMDPEVAKFWDVHTVGDVLSRIGLSKYAHVFEDEEIDLPVFLSLSEGDLKDLGITTFGARRKIVLACDNMKKMFAEKGSNFLTHMFAFRNEQEESERH
eukprot:m.54171 g.54171  ORF g.54171 m.54171 type:complete len:857 (+) comp7706_c0_seq2:394-2964(+)